MTAILGLLSNFLNIEKLPIIAAVALVIITSSFYTGYRVATAFHSSAQLKILEDIQEERVKLESKLRESERELLAEKRNIKERVKEVVRNVPVYINRDDCSVSPDGVRDLNRILSGSSSK